MERQLLTWSIPNMITVWLMLLALFLAFTLIAQAAGGKLLKRGSSKGGAVEAEDFS